VPAAAPSRMRSRAGRRPRRCFWCFGITRAAREYRAELRAGLTTCGTERPARRQSRDSLRDPKRREAGHPVVANPIAASSRAGTRMRSSRRAAVPQVADLPPAWERSRPSRLTRSSPPLYRRRTCDGESAAFPCACGAVPGLSCSVDLDLLRLCGGTRGATILCSARRMSRWTISSGARRLCLSTRVCRCAPPRPLRPRG
jgi:hypothetical protein